MRIFLNRSAKHAIRVAGSLSLVMFSANALAGIECKDMEGEAPYLQCQSESSFEGSTTVDFRKIPSWDGNAHLTLIEMCNWQTAVTPEPVIQEITAITPVAERTACVTRYCSHDSSTYAIAFDTGTIPVGGVVGVGLRVTFSKQKFNVRCETIGETRSMEEGV